MSTLVRRNSSFSENPSSGPALIAHGGGNGAARAHKAMSARASFIEVDLWLHRGRLEARHERRLPGPLPILYELWYLTTAGRPAFVLEDLLFACQGKAGVLLDLKNGLGEVPQILRGVLASFGQEVDVLASSQNWPLLRQVGLACPQIDLFYSIDTLEQFDLFQSVMRHDSLPAGVSCRYSLLNERVIADFHDAGLAVVAWTVDEGDRACELARWGVDAITTNQVEAIRAALANTP